jgi:ATP-dependent DNA helicase Rep
VGITRAQRSLTVSWCKKRKRGRDSMAREPSRFIAEMQAAGTRESVGAVVEASSKARFDGLMALLAKPRPV